MHNKALSLINFKRSKKLRLLQRDIKTVEVLFNRSLRDLASYKKYTYVKTVITSIMESKALLGVYQKKIDSELERQATEDIQES